MNVHDPNTSLELASRNALLLEDHLSQRELYCRECIGKHWLALEAYLAEAVSLDTSRRFSELLDVAEWLATLRRRFERGELEDLEAAQAVRQTRKTIEFLRREALQQKGGANGAGVA